jgi:hypothetical protein
VRLPARTVLDPKQFVEEMNKALLSSDLYMPGMLFVGDNNGYGFEYDDRLLNHGDAGLVQNAVKKMVLG